VWLLVGQWVLVYPFNVHGQNTALRDTGFAIVVSLTALRLLVSRRSYPATGIAMLSGVLLVCAGVWATHSAARGQVNELICGALVVVCAMATLDRRTHHGLHLKGR
jgi:Ca2+/Na+ antiporter